MLSLVKLLETLNLSLGESVIVSETPSNSKSDIHKNVMFSEISSGVFSCQSAPIYSICYMDPWSSEEFWGLQEIILMITKKK